MSLRYAILGLLARESLTGYDLTKRFDSSVACFWSAKHSQIYPELAALSQDGLVTFELVHQASRPNKKIYTITEKGRQTFMAWINEPYDRRIEKDPLMLRTWAVGAVEPTLVLPHLRAALKECDGHCAALSIALDELSIGGAWSPDSPDLGPFLSLRMRLGQSEAYRDWLRWSINTLETMTRQPA